MPNRTPRDTRCYKLRKRGTVVYSGITNDVQRRKSEHIRDGRNFTTCSFDNYPVSRKTASSREKERVETYRQNHSGKRPKYNKIL